MINYDREVSHLQPKDALIIITGTNDIKPEVKIEEAMKFKRSLLTHAYYTKVIMCTTLQRKDNKEKNEEVTKQSLSTAATKRRPLSQLGTH